MCWRGGHWWKEGGEGRAVGLQLVFEPGAALAGRTLAVTVAAQSADGQEQVSEQAARLAIFPATAGSAK